MNSQLSPSQAVLLCGGLGTRLRPLTDNLPKPMVIVNDRPFLHHLLEQLAQQGITRFLLLTGYLSETISNYFGDGSKYGWFIEYSVGPTDWDTGRRFWEARAKFDNRFLLLYSDNFVQFNLLKLIKFHNILCSPISLLLAPKLKGNIKISQDGRILAYDKSRDGTGFDFVEVGYMLVQRDAVLSEFPNCSNFPDISFSEVLKKLVQHQKLSGLVVRDQYHSISDPERLVLMGEYLKHKKILLIDRDGTINEKAPKGEYISSWQEFIWIPETRRAMLQLSKQGFKFIVITNQAGIARQMITPESLENIHNNMVDELNAIGIKVLKVYTCPDHWNENSFMRKPEPGMFFQAAKDFNLRLDYCLYVGDDERDCVAAANAGCGMVYISNEVSRPKLEIFPKSLLVSRSLEDAVIHIVHKYEVWESRR